MGGELHVLQESLSFHQKNKDDTIQYIQKLEHELAEQQQFFNKLAQGVRHLQTLLHTEERHHDGVRDDDFHAEEAQYIAEIRRLLTQAIQEKDQSECNITQLMQGLVQQRLRLADDQIKCDVAEKRVMEWQQQERKNADFKSILQAEVLPPVYKTLEIFSDVKELGLNALQTYKRNISQGQKAVFLMAISGFTLLFLGFVYLLIHTIAPLGQWPWLVLGIVISFAFVLTGVWLKWKKIDTGIIATLCIFMGLSMIYTGVWIRSLNFSELGLWVLFSILMTLNVLIYAFVYYFRVRLLLFVSFAFSLAISTYVSENTWGTSLTYVWCLSMVTFVLAYHLHWYHSVYVLFILSVMAYVYQFIQMDPSVGGFYLLFAQGFFLLYLTVLFSTAAVRQIQLTELYLLITLAVFIGAIYHCEDHTLLAVMLAMNGLCLLLGGLFFYFRLSMLHQSIRLWVMSGLLFVFAIYEWGSVYWPLLAGVEIVFFLTLGFLLKIRPIRQAAYFLMVVTFCVVCYNISTVGWKEHLAHDLSTAWFDFVFMGVFAKLILWLLDFFSSVTNEREKLIAKLLREWLSFWLVLAIFYSAHIFLPNYWLILAWPLSMILLFRSQYLQLFATEVLAWLLAISVPLQLCYAFYVQGNFVFLHLPKHAQLAWLGVLGLLMFMPWVYRYFSAPRSRIRLASVLQTTFYMLLPLFWLADVWFLAPEWFASALWCSALLVLFVDQWHKRKSYFIENVVLTSIAALGTCLVYFDVILDVSREARQFALFNGPMYFSILFFVVKSKVLRHEHHLYHYVVLAGFNFSLLSLLLWTVSWFNGWLMGCFLMQLVAFLVSWKSPAYRLLRGQFPALYTIAVILLLPMIYITHLTGYSAVNLFVLALSVTMSVVLVHLRYGHFNETWDKYRLYEVLLVLTHMCLGLVYFLLLRHWFSDDMQNSLNLVFLLHLAVIFLLSIRVSHYKVLLPLSAVFCVSIALKVFLYDLNSTFETVYVIVVGSFLGVLLVAGSFFLSREYQKKEKIMSSPPK